MDVGCWVHCPKRPLVQCVLEKDTDGGIVRIVSWVDVRFAEEGLEVTVDRGRGSEPGWMVVSTGVTRERRWVDDHRAVREDYRARLQHRPKRKHRHGAGVEGNTWWPWLTERCPSKVEDDALHP